MTQESIQISNQPLNNKSVLEFEKESQIEEIKNDDYQTELKMNLKKIKEENQIIIIKDIK